MTGVQRHVLTAWGLGWVAASRLILAVPRGAPPRWLGWVDGLAARLPSLAPCGPDGAARAVTAAARCVPRTRCLAWTLALRGLLGQAGVSSEVRIGVAPGGAGLQAHAWLECAGRTWSLGPAEGYAVLWPPQPRRSAPIAA
jgi:hypothetical protein